MVFLTEATEPAADIISTVSNIIGLLQPFLDFLEGSFSIFGSLIVATAFIWGMWKKLINPNIQFKKYVNSVYTQERLVEVLKYYIHTRAQDMDPCEQEEIKENNGKFFSQGLIDFFVTEAFSEDSAGKFYLVLADSGMGKTTFILRLYRECLRRYNSSRKPEVKLIPLTDPNCLATLQKIENPENTILLLDAFDENKEAISDCHKFFDELVKATASFNKVVITCRTQFFPNRKEEPAITSFIQVGGRNKRTEIVKKYLSPFNDEEVKLYLKKRFRFNRKLQKRAYKIVRKVPNIMARPLILNWINFLCDSNEDYQFSYQIYDTIITKWIQREYLGASERSLFELSRSIADYMFRTETTTIPAKKVEEIASQKKINLEPIIAKSRSLLNRNGLGEYKFAHRSFLEYFIVFSIFEKMRMPDKTDFLYSLSGTKRFLLEILVSAVDTTDPLKLMEIEQELSKYRDKTGIGNVIDFIQNPKMQLLQRNNEKGFTVEAWQSFADVGVGYNTLDLLKFSEILFNTDGPVYQTIQEEKVLNIGLIFNVLDGEMPPYTTLDIKVERKSVHSAIQNDDSQYELVIDSPEESADPSAVI